MKKIMFDTHCHSDFSTDSKAIPFSQAKTAYELGLKGICFTDHIDYDFPREQFPDFKGENLFIFDIDQYFKELNILKENFQNRDNDFRVFIGVECGLQNLESTIAKNKELAKYPFDQIIGSVHLLERQDPYYPNFWENKKPKKCIKKYFETIYNNLLSFHDFDTLGHIDYIVRYAPKDYIYKPLDFREIIEEILKFIIKKDIALEINTSGLKRTNHFNPHIDILKTYIELGGQMYTIGSDAHANQYIAYKFEYVYEILKELNIKSYLSFENRKAIEHKI